MNTWEVGHARRIGAEIQRLRTRAGISAQSLANRAEEIGLKMTRQAIADLENGRRRYVTTAELMVIAAALDTAPALLLFPDLVDGEVQVLPDRVMTSAAGLSWFAGESFSPFPAGTKTDKDDEYQLESTANYYEGTDRIRKAKSVIRHRNWVSLLRREASNEGSSEATANVMQASLQLDYAKDEARAAGLTVYDSADAWTSGGDAWPDA